MNEDNAEKLNAQLEQHHISLKDFSSTNNFSADIKRYDRTAYLKLPSVQFFQLKIQYETLTLEQAKPDDEIPTAAANAEITNTIKMQDLSQKVTNIAFDDKERGDEPANFTAWLYINAKSSFGYIHMEQQNAYSDILRDVFNTITYSNGDSRFFSSKYNRSLIEANIRKAFYEKRGFKTKEELIPQEAKLLNIDNQYFDICVNPSPKSDKICVQKIYIKMSSGIIPRSWRKR